MSEQTVTDAARDFLQTDHQVTLLFAPAHPASRQRLDAWLGEAPLKNRVRRKTFTPFVGYGAVQSGRQVDDPSQADCLGWDSGLAALIGQGAAADALSRFLDRVIEQRRDGRYLIPYDEPRKEITELRYACLELAYHATLVLVDRWHEEPSPVCDWHLHEIALGAVARDRLLHALKECHDRCEDVQRMPGTESHLLGLAGLVARLRATDDELASGGLSGTLVEWFTDVFWHVMTFDSPAYPRIGELTTQVSLMMGSAEPRKYLIPISRVQRGDYEVLVEAVQKCLKRGLDAINVSAARRLFLASLADVSHVQYAEWDRRIQSGKRSRLGPRFSPQPAVVSTTTLGLDLEFALAAAQASRAPNRTFHVAVPVVADYARPNTGQRRVAVRWLVGDFRVTGAPVDRASITRPTGRWRWLQHWGTGSQGHGWPTLMGPLLLKLAGSPLHDLDRALLPETNEDDELTIQFPGWDPTVDDPVDRYVLHAVTLDEFDVIQRTAFELFELGEQKGSGQQVRILPKWLYESMNSPERWWVYLGPRLTDWNSRMEFVLNRIFVAPHSRLVEPAPVLIGRNIRPDHARILSLLRILPVSGDCFELTASLAELADALPRMLDAGTTAPG
jgi:hypothetical protein